MSPEDMLHPSGPGIHDGYHARLLGLRSSKALFSAPGRRSPSFPNPPILAIINRGEIGSAMDSAQQHHDEEELRKSHRLLLDAESIGQVGSWEIDLETGEVITTEGNRQLFFGDDKTRGARFEDYSDAIHPDDRKWVLRQRDELLAGTGSPFIEYRIVLPNGTERVIRGLQRVVRDADGKPVRAFGTNVDLTERKQAEAELNRRVRQQAAVAQLGQSALRGDDRPVLFDEALSLIVQTCSVEIAEVAELLENDTLLLRAAVGWKDGLVGGATLPAGSELAMCIYAHDWRTLGGRGSRERDEVFGRCTPPGTGNRERRQRDHRG